MQKGIKMTESIKKPRGRPKKNEIAYTQSIRIKEIEKEFLKRLDNVNKFIVRAFKNTKEYEYFLRDYKENQDQPKLFNEKELKIEKLHN